MLIERWLVEISTSLLSVSQMTSLRVPLIVPKNLVDFNFKANNLLIHGDNPCLPDSHHFLNSSYEILLSLLISRSFMHSSSSDQSSSLPSSLDTSLSSLISTNPLLSLSKDLNTLLITSSNQVYSYVRYPNKPFESECTKAFALQFPASGYATLPMKALMGASLYL